MVQRALVDRLGSGAWSLSDEVVVEPQGCTHPPGRGHLLAGGVRWRHLLARVGRRGIGRRPHPSGLLSVGGGLGDHHQELRGATDPPPEVAAQSTGCKQHRCPRPRGVRLRQRGKQQGAGDLVGILGEQALRNEQPIAVDLDAALLSSSSLCLPNLSTRSSTLVVPGAWAIANPTRPSFFMASTSRFVSASATWSVGSPICRISSRTLGGITVITDPSPRAHERRGEPAPRARSDRRPARGAFHPLSAPRPRPSREARTMSRRRAVTASK